jgi:HAD superfamily hydrolase (TIGR01549 family)
MKYWVFDLDGTLVNSFAPYFQILEELMEVKLTSEQKREYIALHPTVVFANHLSQEKAPRALRILQERSESDAKSIATFGAILPTLQLLKEKGCRASIWTSRDLKSAKAIVDHLNLNSYFDHMISGECVSERKPNPEGLLKIQKMYGCSAEEMVMIGDHNHDMEAGRAANVFSVRASWHKYWDDGVCSIGNKQFQCDRSFHEWVRSITLTKGGSSTSLLQ